ncbi:MAG: Clp protease ClpP [Rikenellaceae bacterium]|nr:Clp protease ClpP [Rikenellaceae bacterium]
MNNNTIKIKAAAEGVTIIDIEGVIGVPEECQFDQPESLVATYRKFKQTVESIGQIHTPQVVVNIRSTGGDVEDALLIYDALRGLDAKVTTRCAGYVASAATIIAQAASKGCREIAPEALYLIHRSAMAVEGDADTMRHNAELLDKTDGRIAQIYAEHTADHTPEDFLRLMGENNGCGRWLTPQEALEAGLVDHITEPQKPSGWRAKIRAVVDRLTGRSEFERTTPPSHTRQVVHPLDEVHPDTRTELLRRGQQQVQPTALHECEDPAICDIRRTFNEEAYSRDAANFKN